MSKTNDEFIKCGSCPQLFSVEYLEFTKVNECPKCGFKWTDKDRKRIIKEVKRSNEQG